MVLEFINNIDGEFMFCSPRKQFDFTDFDFTTSTPDSNNPSLTEWYRSILEQLKLEQEKAHEQTNI